MANQYVTVADVRAYTGVGTEEYDENAITSLIEYATGYIEEKTGRVWITATETDTYLDGDGTIRLVLPHVDIQEVSALAIDDDRDGTYTSITLDRCIIYYDSGIIVLNNHLSTPPEVQTFTRGYRTIKVTYTYGPAAPTERIKRLCLKIVANQINEDAEQLKSIDFELQKLKNKGMDIVPVARV